MSKSHNAVNHRVMHKLNRSLILSSLRKSPSQTRAKLAERTGLTRSTVSNLVEELISKNLIYEVGLSASRGGRRGVMLGLNPEGGCAIGMKIGAPAIHCILTNFVGHTLWEKHIALDETEAHTTLGKAEALIQEALDFNKNRLKLLGIGVGITGIIEHDGRVYYSEHLGWEDVVFRERWEQCFGVPVSIDNEVSLAALGENHYGSATNDSHFIFIEVGHGVGAGIVIDGKLYQGINGHAGEIGFMMMAHDTITPWEATVNIPALMSNLRKHHQNGVVSQLNMDDLTFSSVVQAIHDDDALVIDTVKSISKYVGIGIASLVNIFDIHLIILGGELGKQFAPFLDTMRAEILRYAVRREAEDIDLRISSLEPDACLMGAIAQVFDYILQEPSWQASI